MPAMGAGVQTRKQREHLSRVHVADQTHLEQPIVDHGARSDQHTTPVAGANGDGHAESAAVQRLTVDHQAHRARSKHEERLEDANQVRQRPTQMRGCTRAAHDLGVEAAAGDVDERAAVLANPNTTQVDPPHRARQRQVQRRLGRAWQPERPTEVIARPGRDDAQRDVGARKSVGDLGYGPIAADRHDALDARPSRFACKPTGIAARARGRALDPRGQLPDPRYGACPDSRCPPPPGCRIDDDQDPTHYTACAWRLTRRSSASTRRYEANAPISW